MKLPRCITLSIVCFLPVFYSGAEAAGTVTDVLLGKIFDKQIPATVYEQQQQPWLGGSYNIKILRNGQPVFNGGKNTFQLTLPLRAEINGQASLLNKPIVCSADFQTTGAVAILPDFSHQLTRVRSTITLPVPPVMADCGSFRFPIEVYLKKLIADNKLQWEAELDKALNAELKKLAL